MKSLDLPAPLSPRLRIGKYEVVRRLASGGMAEIYLARITGIQGFEKHVVLKRILPQYASREDFVAMFLREARIAATLDQGNIAHVYDIGEVDGGYFYTMEYLHGEDLRKTMSALDRQGKRLPLALSVMIVASVARGLHYAHEKVGQDGRPLGIIHRDVSPSNVVLTFDGDVKLVDFGIAKITADPDLTNGVELKGKVAYMSPEQLRGRPLDRRSDVFSLGLVLFEITTQRRVFPGKSSHEIMQAITNDEIPRPREVVPDYPTELEAIVTKALATDPERRHATARELQRELDAFARKLGADSSSVALADWMTAFWGKRLEPWLESAESPGDQHSAATAVVKPGVLPSVLPEPLPKDPVGEQVSPTRVVTRPDVFETPELPQAHTPSRRSRRSWAGVAAGTLLPLAALSLGLNEWRQAHPRIAAPPVDDQGAAPVVVVVKEQGEVIHSPPAAALSASSAQAPTETVRTSDSAPATKRPRSSRVARPAAPSALAFSGPLARREAELLSCFAGDELNQGTKVEFHFQVDANGRVEEVHVLPETLAGTTTGRCLGTIGATTKFAPTGEPIAFRIPLSLRLRPASGRKP